MNLQDESTTFMNNYYNDTINNNKWAYVKDKNCGEVLTKRLT